MRAPLGSLFLHPDPDPVTRGVLACELNAYGRIFVRTLLPEFARTAALAERRKPQIPRHERLEGAFLDEPGGGFDGRRKEAVLGHAGN